MACVRKRRGKYMVDYRDWTGQRHWKGFDLKKDAEAYRDQVAPLSRRKNRLAVPPGMTVADYAERWKGLIGGTVKYRTVEGYSKILAQHILPEFGKQRVSELDRGTIKSWLMGKLNAGLQKNTVRNLNACFRTMLQAAIDDGLLIMNPASELGRSLRIILPKRTRQDRIKALTWEQRQSFLTTAARVTPRLYPLFLTMLGTGIRPGEALSLQLPDLHVLAGELRIERTVSRRRLTTPKSGHGRTVEMSQLLTETLTRWSGTRKQEILQHGHAHWLFCTPKGVPFDDSLLSKAMKQVLKAAQLPLHFSPHCLRHTYATLLISRGEPIQYVSQQLGHASIGITYDTYGKWLPMGNRAALDRLEYAESGKSGSKVVAEQVTQHAMFSAQLPDFPIQTMELARGIEPPTCGLQNRCSAD
ncbi:MAG: site-specific integrase [Nitrospira sp.]